MVDNETVPKLRFSGFDNEWSTHKLNELSEQIKRKKENIADEDNILTISANKGFISQKERWDDVIAGKSLKKYTYLKKDEFSYNRGNSKSFKYGCIYRLNYENALVPNVYHSFKIIGGNINFFEQLFKSKQLDKQLIKIITSTARMDGLLNISAKNFFNIDITIPNNLKEQKLIGDFLKLVDIKVELLENKYKNYLNFKKYLMQQIFTQKLRFDNTSEWETFALNDIGKTYNGLSGLSKDNFEKGNSKYITYKSIFDNNILKSDFTENVELNNKSQNEVNKGDLFFTGSSETPEEVGMVSVLNSTVKDCYLNSFCFGFRLNNNYDVNPLFLAYYLRSPIMRNKIMILAQGSTRFNLSKKEILKLKVKIPSISEQQQIIELFQNVDNKINEISMQTDNFNEFKKGLLQQMFV